MKTYPFHPHPVDHSLIFRQEAYSSLKRQKRGAPQKAFSEVKTLKWLGRVGQKLSMKLFTFETKNLKFLL